MAGVNPGMVIKVAADIRDALLALGQVVEAEGELQTSTEELDDAYGALDVAIGTFAANAATELFKLAFDAVKALGQELWGVVDAALGVSDAMKAFKGEISDAIRESGVLQAGLESLGTSLLEAFGGSREEAVRTIARLIEQGALKVLDLTSFLIDLGVTGARGIAALIVPIDAVLFVLGELATRLVTFETTLLDLATQVPGVGSKFDGLAAQAHAMAEATRGWTDDTYNQMVAHQALVSGTGPVVETAHQAKAAIAAAKDAMVAQRAAADAATTSLHELTDANTGLVMGSGEAVVALYSQNKALEDMDDWSRKIKNTDPYSFLLQGLQKTLPPLAQVSNEMLHAGAVMKDTGQHAIDMSADVKFAAEVVAKASVTWSEAMDLVRQGQGSMTGQFAGGTSLVGTPRGEWDAKAKAAGGEVRYDSYNNPYIYIAGTNAPGSLWKEPAHMETAVGFGGGSRSDAWLMDNLAMPGGSGTTVNQSVTVNTVAGDSQAIARVVKDAIADDWRTSGMRG
jgi:hypothetical protein